MPRRFMKRSRRKDLDVKLPTRTDVSDWLYHLSCAIRKAQHRGEPKETIRRLKLIHSEFLLIKEAL